MGEILQTWVSPHLLLTDVHICTIVTITDVYFIGENWYCKRNFLSHITPYNQTWDIILIIPMYYSYNHRFTLVYFTGENWYCKRNFLKVISLHTTKLGTPISPHFLYLDNNSLLVRLATILKSSPFFGGSGENFRLLIFMTSLAPPISSTSTHMIKNLVQTT